MAMKLATAQSVKYCVRFTWSTYVSVERNKNELNNNDSLLSLVKWNIQSSSNNVTL